MRCSFTRSCMDEACRVSNHERMISLVPMYCSSQLLHVSWYTAFRRKHNPVLEIGHLSLVHLRSVEVWDKSCLRVQDYGQCMRTEMFSFLIILVIL